MHQRYKKKKTKTKTKDKQISVYEKSCSRYLSVQQISIKVHYSKSTIFVVIVYQMSFSFTNRFDFSRG